jgi:hypothetical protein
MGWVITVTVLVVRIGRGIINRACLGEDLNNWQMLLDYNLSGFQR